MGYVVTVSEHQLERMLAGFEANRGLGLAFAIMQVLLVSRYRLIRIGELGIDQQVVVPGIRRVLPRGSDGDAADAEFDADR